MSKKYQDVFQDEDNEGKQQSNGKENGGAYDEYEFDEDELMKDSSSDEDGDSDNSNSEDEDGDVHIQSTENVEHLEIKLRENKYNFDIHLEYIDALKKAKLIERLREARYACQQLFPLPSSFWLSWLSDELYQQQSPNLNEQEKIDLFERATSDYLSIPIWIQYCKFIENQVILNERDIHSGEDERLKKVRDIFERAIAACCDHLLDCNKLWNTYRTFEQQVLAMIPNDASDETKTKQTTRIRSLYQRQLASPQSNLPQLYQDYEQWEQSQDKPIDPSTNTNLQTRYNLALKIVEDRKDYEKGLIDAKTTPSEGAGESTSSGSGSTLEKYQEYIAFEKKDTNKKANRIITLFERAIQDNYYVVDLWKQYLIYLEYDMKAHKTIIFKVLERASRNVYWSGDIWGIYMTRIEKYCNKDSEQEKKEMLTRVDQVFEKALVAGLSSAMEYQHIFSTRFDILWREEKEKLQPSDDHLVNLFEQHFQREYEVLVSLGMDVSESLMFRAKFEAYQLKNYPLADQTFQQLYTASPHLYHPVDEYIRFKLTCQNDIVGAREIYKKAVKSITEISRIWQDWLNFERINGTLQTLDQATHVYQDTVQRYQAKQQKEFEKQKRLQMQQRKELEDKKRKKEEKQQEGKGDGMGSGDGRGSLKKKKREQTTIFISNLPYSTHSDDLSKTIQERVGEMKELHLVSDKHGKSKGIAFVEFNNTQAAKKCIDTLHGDTSFNEKFPLSVTFSKKEFLKQNEQDQKIQQQFEQEQKRLEHVDINYDNTEGKTVFINNLSTNVTKEKLEAFFTNNGVTVSDIRVIIKARPFAYVDLPTPEQVQNALKLNNKYFLGNYIRVALSKPPGSSGGGGGGGNKPSSHPKPPKTDIVANPFDSKPGDHEITTNSTTTTSTGRKPTLFVPRGLKKAASTHPPPTKQ